MFEQEKQELANEFDVNIKRAYMKIKQLVAEESEDNQKLSVKYQELAKKESETNKDGTVIQKPEVGKKR